MKWQPVGTVLNSDKYVLICTAANQIHVAFFDKDVGRWQPEFFEGNSDDLPRDVTHWMPLPDPPEKESK